MAKAFRARVCALFGRFSWGLQCKTRQRQSNVEMRIAKTQGAGNVLRLMPGASLRLGRAFANDRENGNEAKSWYVRRWFIEI